MELVKYSNVGLLVLLASLLLLVVIYAIFRLKLIKIFYFTPSFLIQR